MSEQKQFNDVEQEYQKRVANSYASIGINPDEFSKHKKTAKALGVPVPAVSSDPRNALIRERILTVEQAAKDAPTLKKRLSDFSFFGSAHDDVENLSELERSIRKYGSVAAAPDEPWYKELYNSARRGWASGTNRLNFVGNLFVTQNNFLDLDRQRAQAAAAAGVHYDSLNEAVINYMDRKRKETRYAPSLKLQQEQNEMSKISGLGEAIKFAATHPRTVFNTVAESAGSPQMLGPVIGGAVAGKGGMVAGSAITSFANEYAAAIDEVVSENKDQFSGFSELDRIKKVINTPELMQKAKSKGVKRGLLVGAFDAVSAGIAGRFLGGAKPGVVSPALRTGGEITAQAALGAGGEAAGQLATGEYKPMDIVLEAVSEIPLGLASARSNFKEARSKAAEAQLERAQVKAEIKQNIDNAARYSKLAKRDLDAFGEFVHETGEANGIEGFYIDADALHQSGIADAMVQNSPSIAAQYRSALESGGAVFVPLEEYATRVATKPELAQSLDEMVRVEPDGDTLAEIKNFNAAEALQHDVEQQAQQAIAEADTAIQSDAVFSNVYEQLKKLGRFSDEVSRQQALLAANAFRVLAKRLNRDVEDLWQAYPIRLAGETADGSALHQALKNHPPKGWVHSESGADAGALYSSSSTSADANNKAVFWTHLGDRIAQEIEGVTGFSHSFSSSAARHIFKRHGAKEIEEKRGQKPITEADIARIPDIIANFDAVRTDLADKKGTQQIAYAKKYDDGIVVYLEKLSRKRQDFQGVSMWKYPPAGDAQTRLAANLDPALDGLDRKGAYENATTNQELKQEARGSFAPDSRTIALLKGADLSTFQHELGHFMLEMNIDIAQQLQARLDSLTVEERLLLSDMDATMRWLGLTDLGAWRALSFEEKRPYHEQFARGFEAYLFEGKAPNLEMRSVFARVRDWMVSVYKNLKALRVELTDEVRAVFDRMVASDEQIQEAQRAQHMHALFTDAQTAGMSEQEFTEYFKDNLAATDDAITEIQSRALSDIQYLRGARHRYLKNLQRQAKKLRARVREEVTAEVIQQPVYQAWSRLTAKGDVQVRLDASNLAQLGISTNDIKLLRRRRMVAKEGGLDADAIADTLVDEHGRALYSSGEAMVRDLVAAPRAREAIEAMVDQTMLKRHGEFATEQVLQEAADVAVFNRMRLRVLRTEYNALAKALGLPSILQKAAKEYAQDAISRLRVKELKPALYRRQAAKAAKAADLAMKKGDLHAAATAKRNQLIQSALADAANTASGEVQRAKRQWAAWGSRTRSKYVKTHDVGLVEAVKTVVGLYGVSTKKGEKAAEYIDRLRQYDPDKYQAVAELINRAMADNDEHGRHRVLDDLAISEFRTLTDELKSLMAYSRRSQQIRLGDRLLDRREVVQQLTTILAARYPNTQPTKIDSAPGTRDVVKSNLQTLEFSARRVESWARALGKPFQEAIFKPVKRGAEQYRKETAQYLQEFRNLLEPIQKDFSRGKTAKIEALELGYTFKGMNELLHALLHTGNDSNKRKLLLGYGWGELTPSGELSTAKWDAFINRMIHEGRLRKEHFDFAQGVWDLLERTKVKAQQAHNEVFGYYFDEVSADELQTPFGNYKGGYIPAIADPRLVFDQQLRTLSQNENENMAFAFPTTNKGFTKSRVEYNRPLLLDMRTLAQHIDKVVLFSNLEAPVRDVQRIVRDLGDALNRYQHGSIEGMLQPWLNRAARQKVATPGTADGGLSRLFTVMRSRAGMGLMFANVSNAVQQIAGFAVANVRVPAKYLLRANADWIKNPRAMAREVSAVSDFMSQRMDNEVAAMNEHIRETLINPNMLEKVQSWTSRNAYFMQTAVANMMEPIIWKAAYQHALDTGHSEAHALAHADEVVRETQGSTLPEDVSRMETGAPFYRLFTQFWGYFNMLYNLYRTEMTQILHEGGMAENKARAAHLFMMGYYIPAVVAEVIAQAFNGGPADDDGDGYLDDWIQATLFEGPFKTTAAMVPGVGQGVMALNDFIKHKPDSNRLTSSPAVSLTTSAVRALYSVPKAVTDDGSKRRAVKDFASLITLTLGVPGLPAARPLGYAAGVSEGKINPTGPVDAVRGTVVGTASPESKM